MRRTRYLSLLLLALTWLSGCTFIPKLDRPVGPIADSFPGGNSNDASGAGLAWKQVFADPKLKQLIDLALVNNRDLRVAMLNVEETWAQYRIQQSAYFPFVNGTGGFTRQRQQGEITNQTNASVGLTSYELDLFGKVRSQNQEALENYFSKTEAKRSAQITLVSEVATQYYTVVRAQELLKITQETLRTVDESYRLNKATFDAGGTNELDLKSSDAQVLTAKSNVIVYERQLGQAQNGLVLLIGQPLPGNLVAVRGLADARVQGVPAGLPSELLNLRPDILQAERTLRAANANIGAAQAAFFPSVKLTSSAGSSSAELSELFTRGTASWSFAPQVSVPIFNGGNNQANLDVAKIRTRKEIANYEKAIQTAFREVSDALIARSSFAAQIVALESLVAAQQQRYNLAAARFNQGVDTYLNVLSAQQDHFRAQQDLILTRYEAVAARISVYKAIGGGWK